ncbi:hypothetical protein C8R45DRAFT_1104696 [Mycena sanguinolenta]|nr:hypothetical protein C8R45DRAFT_1104696 [Mycena sanguinolenta]
MYRTRPWHDYEALVLVVSSTYKLSCRLLRSSPLHWFSGLVSFKSIVLAPVPSVSHGTINSSEERLTIPLHAGHTLADRACHSSSGEGGRKAYDLGAGAEGESRGAPEGARSPVLDDAEEACTNWEVYNACDVPLDVVADHLLSGGSAVATNFAVAKDGGISRSGSAEASEDEDGDE